MLDTGFDCPEVRNLVMARFTHSIILYRQMRGRGTRLAPGKDRFTMWDFTGVTLRHGDDETPGEGGAVVERPAEKPQGKPRRMLTLDVHDEIDPSTREWVTVDETGNAYMDVDEARVEALGASFETWLAKGLDGHNFNTDQLRLLHLIKEQIKANATELTAFESWRFDAPPLSMNGGFERARAVFGNEVELERVLASLNKAVFGIEFRCPRRRRHAPPRQTTPLKVPNALHARHAPQGRSDRDYLYGGGYPDPLSNAEQLSFLFFFYMIEGIDAANLRRAKATKRQYASLFAGDWTLRNPLNAPSRGVETIPRERMRWSSWANAMSGEQLVTFVRDEVFPFFAGIGDAFGMSFMAQARLTIDEPTVLTQVVTLVNELRLEQADPDTKGDLFEHVLRQIKQAGELGQFRTPRHIIRAIVDLVDPKIGETVYDPAAGTAGFLVAAYEHIRLANSSANGREIAEFEGKRFERGLGDQLNAAQWHKLQAETFYGNDVDPKMVSLASMNLALRGLPDVRILKRNVLTTSFDRQAKAEKGLPLDGYNVVLANPPFSGRIDRDRIVDDVKVGTSTATELLFVKYMIDNLKDGGRCGVIVPEACCSAPPVRIRNCGVS